MQKVKLQEELSKLTSLKTKLLNKKEKATLSAEEQKELENTVTRIVDIEEELEKIAADEQGKVEKYQPKDDEKHLVHAELTFGKRFDPETGVEVSSPYVQKFSVAEFSSFEKTAPSLGYAVKVIYAPKQ